MISDIEETICCFKEIGFTEYEAKVYMSLLSEHPASAYTISQNSGVPHSRVYDITRRLIKKGVALSAGTNPELFSPLSPDELVEKLRRDNTMFTAELKDLLKSAKFVSDFDPVWNLHNKHEALDMAGRLISEAETKIYIGIWAQELPELEPSLRLADSRGVKIFALIYGQALLDFGEVYYHGMEHMEPICELGKTLDLAVDSNSCVTGTLGRSNDCQVVWTRNKGLVQTVESYIVHDLYLAEINKRFRNEIDNAFGNNLYELRKKFGG